MNGGILGGGVWPRCVLKLSTKKKKQMKKKKKKKNKHSDSAQMQPAIGASSLG